MDTTPRTDAQTGATLDGSSWLSGLLKTAAEGWIAVETVRNQNRGAGTVTTDAPVRVGSAESSGLSQKTVIIGVGIALLALLLGLMFSRRS
ncbi:MAG: hypothetical protein C0502_05040 [Opitutus sp.]|nr:hypothetical protein [Opitutus sp.]